MSQERKEPWEFNAKGFHLGQLQAAANSARDRGVTHELYDQEGFLWYEVNQAGCVTTHRWKASW